jgi:hypothetical protein
MGISQNAGMEARLGSVAYSQFDPAGACSGEKEERAWE